MKLLKIFLDFYSSKSHSARSAWIETRLYGRDGVADMVALRKECVD